MSNEGISDEDIPKFCSNCGNPLRPNIKFCTVCGKQIFQTPPVQNPTQPSSPLPTPTDNNPNLQNPQPVQNQPPNQINQPAPFFPQAPPQGQQQQRGIVSSNIKAVSGKFFERSELRIAVLFGLTGFFSHFIRYLILFNSFPGIVTLLLPIPFYILLGFLILGMNKLLMRNRGVDIEFEADNYDYMVSSVFSSFFLSLMNYRFKFKPETSTIPDIVYHPQNTKQGMQYLELPKTRYVGLYVRPQAFFSLMIFTTVLGLFTLYYYFQNPFTDFGLIARFISMYLGGYGVSHLSPRVGRINEEMATVGRFRTLFVFLISFFIFLVALIGNRFFTVL